METARASSKHRTEHVEHAAYGEARAIDPLHGDLGVPRQPNFPGQLQRVGERRRQSHCDQDDTEHLLDMQHDIGPPPKTSTTMPAGSSNATATLT